MKKVTKLGIQIGVILPQSTYYYLKLYSKARMIPMHRIIHQAIQAVVDYTIFPSVEELRENMISRIKQEWAIEIGRKGIVSKEEQNNLRRDIIKQYEGKMNRLAPEDFKYIISEVEKAIKTGTQLELWKENKD